MDLQDWTLLKVLSEQKSTVKAAKSFFISQPAVMYRVNRMEREMGVLLFVRNNKGLSLTEAGERLLSFADRILEQDNHIKAYVKSPTVNLTGTITIGSSAAFANRHLLPHFKEFSKLYPTISLSLVMELNHVLAQMINENKIIIAIIRGEHRHKLREYHVYDDPLVIISSHPITTEYLTSTPFIRFYRDPLLLSTIDHWIQMNFQGSSIVFIDSNKGSYDCLQLVKAGIGWSIVSYTNALECDKIYIKPIRDTDDNLYIRPTKLIYNDFAYASDIYRTYIEHFCSFFKSFKCPEIHDNMFLDESLRVLNNN